MSLLGIETSGQTKSHRPSILFPIDASHTDGDEDIAGLKLFKEERSKSLRRWSFFSTPR
jgi:hypothetical protein